MLDRVSHHRRPPASKFRRLALTHALMVGGDTAMIVALADSLFFDIDLDAARSRVLLFLVVGFAPFLVIAPLIGPLIDGVAGGRRLVIQLVALARVGLMLLMAQYLDALALFPLVFAALVLQKTYVVSKSAIVPSTVRLQPDLVFDNGYAVADVEYKLHPSRLAGHIIPAQRTPPSTAKARRHPPFRLPKLRTRVRFPSSALM